MSAGSVRSNTSYLQAYLLHNAESPMMVYRPGEDRHKHSQIRITSNLLDANSHFCIIEYV